MRYMLLIYGDETAFADMDAGGRCRRPCRSTRSTRRGSWRRAGCAPAIRSRTRTRRPPSGMRDGNVWPPTGRSPRRRSSWAATTSWSATNLDEAIEAAEADPGRRPRAGPSRSGPSSTCERGRPRSSTACSGASRGGRSRRSSACSATSTWPRRPCRRRSRSRSNDGRSTAFPTTPAPGSRPPPATERSTASGGSSVAARRPRTRTRIHDLEALGDDMQRDPRRPAPVDLHLLPPRAADGCPGGLDAPDGRRAIHAGDRPRVHRHRADDPAAPGPREEEDPRRRHPLPRAAARAASRAVRRRARRALPDLQRGLRRDRGTARPRGALRRGDLAGARAHATDARANRRRSACSRSCCCSIPAEIPAWTRWARSFCSRTRTDRAGTTT